MSLSPSRRNFVVASAAAAALLPLQKVVAQTAAASGDWMDMVQAQHALIAKSFDTLMAAKSVRARKAALNAIAYQLTAHSTAEENVLYPALAMNGLMTEADKLYLDQAHAKVLNAELDMGAQKEMTESPDWKEKAQKLQAAILKHAKDDEEGTYYPQLKQKLDAMQNSQLTAQYRLQFGSVKPTTIVF